MQLIYNVILRLDALLWPIDRVEAEEEFDVSLKLWEQGGENDWLIEVSSFFGIKLVKKYVIMLTHKK